MELLREALNVPKNAEVLEKPSGLQEFDRHYTVAQLSKLWFFSESTIRRLFTKEPGVIKIAHQPTRVRRGYTSLRIPERVAQRVHRRLQGLAS
jgi:hypothetical protein